MLNNKIKKYIKGQTKQPKSFRVNLLNLQHESWDQDNPWKTNKKKLRSISNLVLKDKIKKLKKLKKNNLSQLMLLS
jgi:hypothetical protein